MLQHGVCHGRDREAPADRRPQPQCGGLRGPGTVEHVQHGLRQGVDILRPHVADQGMETMP